MPQVTVTIGSRQYRMTCEDGQEIHLLELGNDLDRRIDSLREKFGEIGDARLIVIAALMVTDELAEARERIRKQTQDLAMAREARVVEGAHADQIQASIAATLDAAAERIEDIAKALNERRDTNNVAIG